MLQLQNGCSCSEPSIHPKNWRSGGQALLKKPWYIQYYFRDPNFKDQTKYKYGKLVIVKGVNHYTTLEERRAAIQFLQKNEIDLLTNYHYNPITGSKVDPIIVEAGQDANYCIEPYTLFFEALEKVYDNLDCSRETLRDIKSVLKYTRATGIRLGYDRLEISSVRRKHIKILLDQLGKIQFPDDKGKMKGLRWTANRFNVYRKYLHRLFEELIEMEATEINPVKRIKKMQSLKKIRLTMSLEERKKVNLYLLENYPSFWRFCQIFFHSGGRITELLLIKRKDVDLSKQRYKAVIKKGKGQTEVFRTIKDNILPLWIELLQQADKNDFIFSAGLKPGPKSIDSHQITRRWRTQVKEKLDITADIYSLKHSNLDETAAILDALAASKMAGHTSTVVTMEHYLVGEKEREHLRLKSVNNEFG